MPNTRIIQRFVPRAEAVIFVLDSASPISEFELDSINDVLRYTRHIFFVQTQIALYGEEEWQAVWERNCEILDKRFPGRIGSSQEPIMVWPVSGKQLLSVMRTDKDGILVHSSRFPMSEIASNLSEKHWTFGIMFRRAKMAWSGAAMLLGLGGRFSPSGTGDWCDILLIGVCSLGNASGRRPLNGAERVHNSATTCAMRWRPFVCSTLPHVWTSPV